MNETQRAIEIAKAGQRYALEQPTSDYQRGRVSAFGAMIDTLQNAATERDRRAWSSATVLRNIVFAVTLGGVLGWGAVKVAVSTGAPPLLQGLCAGMVAALVARIVFGFDRDTING